MARLPTHHPSDDLLLEYASGSQREPVALLIATHLTLCPRCRDQIGRLEAIGGALLEGIAPAPLAEDSFARLLARLDDPAGAPERPVPGTSTDDQASLPEPLRGYVGRPLDQLSWRRFGPISEARLLQEAGGFTTRLLRVRPGAAIPDHTHEGSELALVLAGGFRDRTEHFLHGDVAQADPEIDHRPVADPDQECVCLVVTDAPLRLTGPIGRLVGRWTRF